MTWKKDMKNNTKNIEALYKRLKIGTPVRGNTANKNNEFCFMKGMSMYSKYLRYISSKMHTLKVYELVTLNLNKYCF